MELVSLVINVVAMIATVISCVIAVKAKNDTVKMIANINNSKNRNQKSVTNSGSNKGVVAGTISGGVTIGKS